MAALVPKKTFKGMHTCAPMRIHSILNARISRHFSRPLNISTGQSACVHRHGQANQRKWRTDTIHCFGLSSARTRRQYTLKYSRRLCPSCHSDLGDRDMAGRLQVEPNTQFYLHLAQTQSALSDVMEFLCMT